MKKKIQKNNNNEYFNSNKRSNTKYTWFNF